MQEVPTWYVVVIISERSRNIRVRTFHSYFQCI